MSRALAGRRGPCIDVQYARIQSCCAACCAQSGVSHYVAAGSFLRLKTTFCVASHACQARPRQEPAAFNPEPGDCAAMPGPKPTIARICLAAQPAMTPQLPWRQVEVVLINAEAVYLAQTADTDGCPAAWHTPKATRTSSSPARAELPGRFEASGVAALTSDHATRPIIMTRSPPRASAMKPAGTCRGSRNARVGTLKHTMSLSQQGSLVRNCVDPAVDGCALQTRHAHPNRCSAAASRRKLACLCGQVAQQHSRLKHAQLLHLQPEVPLHKTTCSTTYLTANGFFQTCTKPPERRTSGHQTLTLFPPDCVHDSCRSKTPTADLHSRAEPESL